MPDSTRFRFTKKLLADLRPEAKTYQVSDTGARGLILIVTASGAKTFYRYGRINGSVRRVKIGTFPEFSVQDARDRCEGINVAIAKDEPLKATRGGLTVADLWTQYWDEHALPKKAESSRKHDDWQWTKIIKPAMGRAKAAKVAKADVVKLHGDVAKKRGKTTANRVLSLVKKLYNHAIEQERLQANPAATVKKFREESRERFIQGDELPKFFAALNAFDNQDAADFWRICLFTGARQANVLAMKWGEIDFTDKVWTIPKTKSQKSQRVPLVDAAIQVLEGRRNRSEFVFASHSKTGHITRPGKAWERLLKEAGIENLTMHDLRRSLGSYQAAAGVSELIIGKTLGHAAGSRATSVYARLNLDPVRDAVSVATAAMLEAAAKGGADDE